MRWRWWRPLWRLAHDDVVAWAGGSRYRRSQLDTWLGRHGLPPGSELTAGSICAVADRRGRPWLVVRRLDGRQLRVPLVQDPPARLPVTAG